MEDGRLNPSREGFPQGSIIGPLLANIFLDNLDKFMKAKIAEFNIGLRRRSNPAYTKIVRSGKGSAAVARRRKVVPLMYKDTNFKRLRYIRYADDFIIGVDGSKEDAMDVYKSVSEFLTTNLSFELKNSGNKCLTHYRTEKSMFLGVYIRGHSRELVPVITKKDGTKARSSLRPMIILPFKEIKEKLIELGFARRIHNRYSPTRCGRLVHHDPVSIVLYYNSIYIGLCHYYAVCNNRALMSRVY